MTDHHTVVADVVHGARGRLEQSSLQEQLTRQLLLQHTWSVCLSVCHNSSRPGSLSSHSQCCYLELELDCLLADSLIRQ